MSDNAPLPVAHVIMVSQPDAVADVILTAAAAVDRAPAGMRG
jgi:hypothetical protein